MLGVITTWVNRVSPLYVLKLAEHKAKQREPEHSLFGLSSCLRQSFRYAGVREMIAPFFL